MSMIDKAKMQLTKCAKCVGCSRLDDDTFRGDNGCFQFKAAEPDIEAMKRTYNDSLKRINKAIVFMDGPAEDEKKNKWFPEFVKIWKDIEAQLIEFDRVGCVMTDKEVLNGFI